MIKIGITGQTGFIGTHLFNTIGLYQDKFIRIPFQNELFRNDTQLQNFVNQCDVIVHLAAMNRHNDPEVIYNTNIGLVNQLIAACESTQSTPHILFSSSTQEDRDNLYGRSKKEGRKLLEQWADINKGQFTGLIIPNVYGPFGHPYYNSVVATFCHQITHNEQPRIEVDGTLKLIYVGELVSQILEIVEQSFSDQKNNVVINEVLLQHTAEIKVSALLKLIQDYKDNYFERGEIPDLSNPFHKNIWNTFLCYLDHQLFYPFYLNLHTDNRGSFAETAKFKSGGQVSFSTTAPGITRGNHYHTRKSERFIVIKGQAKIEIRRIGTDLKYSFLLNGDRPSFVDMPIWFTHNVTNIGDDDLYTIFWINEEYDSSDPDTYFEEV
jgi:UDP-2-acetamido-2,6-beta-L-arabino-hexul-4-ose reductase